MTVQVDEVQMVPDGFGFHLKASEYTWITGFETKVEAEAAHSHVAKAIAHAKALKNCEPLASRHADDLRANHLRPVAVGNVPVQLLGRLPGFTARPWNPRHWPNPQDRPD
jgi:hypothetical protein